jgi:hypothetical protein
MGFLIAVGSFLAILGLGYFGGELGSAVVGLLLLGTLAWACIDSYRIRKQYGTKDTTAHPVALLFMLVGLWVVIFPIYLVTRSRVLANGGRTSPPSATAEAKSGKRPIRVGAAVACALGFIVLGSAALYIGSGSSIKGIWSTTNPQLAPANTTVPTPQTSTAAAVPTAVANAAPIHPDVLEFTSVEDLLNGYEEQARDRSVKVKGKINGFTLTNNSVELESTPNERVVCNFAPGEREKFGNLDLERVQQITATLGDRVEIGETPMSGKTIYKIDLMGCRLQ